ncbi:hypothetical protein FKW77_000893 [Venturia effusa]|uniref:Uncharacterized protein n=1 Tax=Venturia effusa TaxID=50376 RepID=A0A517LNB7_9PEZI|nr:hypothetical protein FKW77_000893 [Venturia effusa]
MPRSALAPFNRRPMRSAVFPSHVEQPSTWLILDHSLENELHAKRPILHQRASSNLDPAVPIFVPNPQAPIYVSPAVPKTNLTPQTRDQETQYPYQQNHLSDHEPRTSFIPPPISIAQQEIHGHRVTHHRLEPSHRSVAPRTFPQYLPDPTVLAQIDALNQVCGPNVTAAFLESTKPTRDASDVKEPEMQKNIKYSSRAARWREKKALEGNQRAQAAGSTVVSFFEDSKLIGHRREVYREVVLSSIDENEWNYEDHLPPKTQTAAGLCREDGSWANISEICDDGHDRATFELQHRVNLNRQTFRKAPIKPVARLLHEEILEQWFRTGRSLVRMSQSMSGYAKRAAEMTAMSEEDLELLMRDKQVGIRLKDMALIYQGVTYKLQKEYFGNDVWG